MFYWMIKIAISPFVRAIWVKSVEGELPKRGPVIIAANHMSYLDFLSLVAVSGARIYFLTAEKFFKSIFWQPIVYLTGQIRVDRTAKDKSHTHINIVRILNKNKILAIFPEGKRSRNGKLQKAYNGIAKIAINHKIPVVPIGIRGTNQILPPHQLIPKLKKDCLINIGKPLYFDKYYYEKDNDETFGLVTTEIMNEIARLSYQEYSI